MIDGKVKEVVEQVGAKMTAVCLGMDSTAQLVEPLSDHQANQLSCLDDVIKTLKTDVDSNDYVYAVLRGMNPYIDDNSIMIYIRDGKLKEARFAARGTISGGFA